MDRRKETGMAVIVGMIILLAIAMTMLLSCTTKEKMMTEHVYVHDTIRSYKTDTLREVSYQVRRDTLRLKETHTITLNNVGDTIREIHHYHDSERVIMVDSTDRYRSVVDSLRAALAREQSKSKEVTKRKVPLSAIARWLIISALVLGVFIVVLRSKTNS